MRKQVYNEDKARADFALFVFASLIIISAIVAGIKGLGIIETTTMIVLGLFATPGRSLMQYENQWEKIGQIVVISGVAVFCIAAITALEGGELIGTWTVFCGLLMWFGEQCAEALNKKTSNKIP